MNWFIVVTSLEQKPERSRWKTQRSESGWPNTDVASIRKAKSAEMVTGLSQSTAKDLLRLLEIDGQDIRNEPLLKRKARLEKLIGNHREGIVYNEHLDFSGEQVFDSACRMGLEGMVSKKVGSRYQSGRSKDWLKAKNPDIAAVKRHAEGSW